MPIKGTQTSSGARWKRPFFTVFSSMALLFGTAGCELIAGVDRSKIEDNTTGGQGGSDAGMPECSAAGDCPGMDTECGTRTCTAGVCGMDFTPAGTPLLDQLVGDCKADVCDGQGAVMSQNDDADIPDDMNPCTDDTCAMGVPNHTPSTVGTTCSVGQGTLCDGMGACVECLVGGNCLSGVCVNKQCAAPTCMDSVKNGDETDVDCGGSCPSACTDGQVCGVNADCTSGVCTGNVCQAPTCSDNTKNGSETDVDCGGACPNNCADGQVCGVDADCTSGVCTGNVCQAPTCNDNTKNGSETDVDCGGACPNACNDGQMCGAGSDCTSGVCTGNLCQAPACGDGVKNGSETDVDCGGACPNNCADGQICGVNADCTSSVCTGNVCQAPTCSDNTKNGSESDVDCGGACPNACNDGQMCGAGSDCTSGVCTGNLCQAPACGDGVKNGSESDVDCGGACPSACADGQVCGVNADCISSVCTGNVCQAPTCSDNTQNGSESDVDCGGACPSACADGQGCGVNTDCTSGVCTGNICQVPACNDGVKNGSESDVDCGGACPNNCADGQICGTGADCISGVCVGNVCQVPACNDSVKNGSETGVDCGGSCPSCPDGSPCLVSTDCTSGVCTGNVCQAPACGDGVVNGADLCDDGNTANGDCCASNCTPEPQCGFESEPNETCPGPDVDGPYTPILGGVFTTSPGVSYQASINPAGDQDYFAFTIAATASVTIETFSDTQPGACVTGVDTLVELLAGDCTSVLAADDDDGLSTCSLIDPATDSGARMLAPGTYYVHLFEYQNNDVIPAYNVSVTLTSLCGNNSVEAYEGCDDGNTAPGDGCAADCTVEPGYACTGNPSVCGPSCANGTLDAGEQCDDGNVANGDGCSSVCTVEQNYQCSLASPNVCATAETNCNDGVDNDGDSLTDAADSDCALAASVTCGAGESLYVFNSAHVPQPISDFTDTMAYAFVTGTGAGTVTNTVVALDITHTYDGDLDISLSSGLGTLVTLSNSNGGFGQDYTATLFDSSCATDITMGSPPFTGCFAPEQSLTLVSGEAAAGPWMLNVYDGGIGDSGTLNSWSLALCIAP